MTRENWNTIYQAVSNIQSASGNLRVDPFEIILQTQCDGLTDKITITERNINLLEKKIVEENIALDNIYLTLSGNKRNKCFFWRSNTNENEGKKNTKMMKKRIRTMKEIKQHLEHRSENYNKQLEAIAESLWLLKIRNAKQLYWTFIYKNVIEYPFLETIEEERTENVEKEETTTLTMNVIECGYTGLGRLQDQKRRAEKRTSLNLSFLE
ncbi:uncharacterized protein LOC143783366 isoform X2 [Ranitomeya variabilis]|uniref:uncharacterized protein LOC143783366 isoform X2 n=1 Tax=Ranitomeya variabilis TaxID=490064 RepID=UPI004055E21D